ncbi:MAG: hypothetical protein ABI972_20640 [Acidobacteriota bacterium]
MTRYPRLSTMIFLLGAALPVGAQFFGDYNHPEFTVQHDPNWSDQRRQGQCEIRISVDNQVDVELRWDKLRLVTLAGTQGRDRGSVCDAPLPQSGVSNVRLQRLEGRGQMSLLEPPGPENGWAAIVRIADKSRGERNYSYRLTWQWDGTSPQVIERNRSGRRSGGSRARNNNSTQRLCRQALTTRLKDEWGAVVENYDRGNAEQGRGNATVAGRANIRAGNDRRQVDYQCYVNPVSNQVDQVYYDFAGARFPWNPQLPGSETAPPGADTTYNIISECQDVIRRRAAEQMRASTISFHDISRKWWEGNLQRVNGRATTELEGRTVMIDYNCTARQNRIEWGDFRVLDGARSN